MEYKDFEELKEKLLYKRIVGFDENTLTLEDGLVLSIVEAEQDCCAYAYGTFKDVKLDAVITNISNPKIINRKIAYGTKNILKEPAMTKKQAEDAIQAGIDLAGDFKK